MKIALPTRGGVVDEHFGHCEYYTIFTVEDGQVVDKSPFDSPPGCGCKSNIAPVLADNGVEIMLAGNIGQGAVNVLAGAGIRVVRGCAGPVEDVLAAWLAGDVKDQPIICDHHDCGNH